jgi:uncharacterized integral membrane protein
MQFLRVLFWCLLAFVAAVFTFGNWRTVSIQLFGGLVAEVNLPLLLLVTFLIGFVPTFGYQRWMRWRVRQRLVIAERALEAQRHLASVRPATIEQPVPTEITETPSDRGDA